MDKDAKKNISTKQSPTGEKARLQIENEHRGRAQCNKEASPEGSEGAHTRTLLDFTLPKDNRIRKRADFQKIYANGKQIKGRFMTAFVLPSETSFQRIGVTASKKGIGNAVCRNRAKRLLRECFRLSKNSLSELNREYDWVLNARRAILDVKVSEPQVEFLDLVRRILLEESGAHGNKTN